MPDNPACDYLDRQYMLGDNVMVAPCSLKRAMCSSTCRKVAGHLWHNDELDGSRWREQQHGFLSLPFMCVITLYWRWATTINVPITCSTRHGIPPL
ncbi:hypothetical protein ACLK1T_12835 [Escherichia coli]